MMIATKLVDYPNFLLTTGDGHCQLELLPEHGGIINRLAFQGDDGQSLNVIAGFSSLAEIESDGMFRGIPLYPFANRLQDGCYQWLGKPYQLDVNEPAHNNTLHGFIQHLTPVITRLAQDSTRASARLDYSYAGDLSGYPFPARISMLFDLNSAGELTLELNIRNDHTDPVPVGAGWHPYYRLGVPVNQLSLQLPTVKRVHVDSRMLPTGDLSDYRDFAELTAIGATEFDTCFQVSGGGINPTETKVIICTTSPKVGLELWQETGEGKYNFIQVCIPPDRQSIAVEPVSCGINAFNTKHGLVTLAPGEEWSAKCGVRFIKQQHNIANKTPDTAS